MIPLARPAAALALALLTACANEPTQVTDIHTGITAGVSARHSVFNNLLVNVTGQAFIAQKGKEVRQGIYVDQVSTATGWSFFHSAYSFGTQLPYERGASNVLSCASLGCTVQEQGAVILTPAQFDKARSTGMELLLQGSGNRVVIQVPAEAFEEAHSQRPG
ncbi:hypothetical protein IV417_16035 [Alphaproteobacteria bacterium KMM 3653]|uniref:Lipoprotein n=1 Tax=Harenicola maris TaxID=2841044 RepID=A0AAP2CRC4_9RHOB|nr:hypothetical protein [Harenicola maris]